MRKAVSVTLKTDNLLWLRAQAAASSRGSLSEVLDQLVTDARESGRTDARAIRSVKGTIDLPDDDPALEQADAFIRTQFDKSLRRPVLVKEQRARYTGPRKIVTDVPAAVSDTHALLFHAAGGGRLGRRAAAHFEACERRQAILYVPAAVIWECGLLARGGRINLRRTVEGSSTICSATRPISRTT